MVTSFFLATLLFCIFPWCVKNLLSDLTGSVRRQVGGDQQELGVELVRLYTRVIMIKHYLFLFAHFTLLHFPVVLREESLVRLDRIVQREIGGDQQELESRTSFSAILYQSHNDKTLPLSFWPLYSSAFSCGSS